jgi:hypothetical protein
MGRPGRLCWVTGALLTVVAGVASGDRPKADVQTLIGQLGHDDVRGNMDRAVSGLVNSASDTTIEPLLAAWRSATDPQARDALTAILWYHEIAIGYEPQVGLRTVAMLTEFEGSGPMLDGTLYGQDVVAMRFLELQVRHERWLREWSGGAQRGPVTETLRRLAKEGSGRPRFLAWALLAFAHEPGERAAIIDFMRPHLGDNGIRRDAGIALHACREIAREDPALVRKASATGDEQAREALRRALSESRHRPAVDEEPVEPFPWPRLPDAEHERIDALHGGNDRRRPRAMLGPEPGAEFTIDGMRLRPRAFTCEGEGTPEAWIEGWRRGRWEPVNVRYHLMENGVPLARMVFRWDGSQWTYIVPDAWTEGNSSTDPGAANAKGTRTEGDADGT